MIINLLILLLIVIAMCNSITYNSKYKCPKYEVKINYVRASRLPGDASQGKLVIDMVKLKFDRDVPCGMYSLINAYGKGVLFVSSSDSRTGYMNMKNMNSIAHINLFDLWELYRLESNDNGFIQTYNRGCCN